MADEAALKTLFLKGLAGDEAATRAFLTEAAALLRAFFRSRLRGRAEDAEDLVQETLVALHTRRESYDPSYPLTAWLYAIARYRLIDFLRRAKHRAHASLDGIDVGEPDPDYEASDAKRDVATLLDKLPEKQRTAIRMVKLEERSVKETSEATGLSESDIKISIHRGLKTLMRLMGEEQTDVKTDDLINALSRGVEPAERPRWRMNLAITLVVGLIVAVALVAIGLGVRPDIGTARMPVMMKAMFSALAAAVILPVAVQLMKPGRPLGWRLFAIALFVGVCAIATATALMGEMPEQRWQAWMGGEGRAPWCVVLIPILAVPAAALLTWFMRAFTPTRITLTGAAIGALSGGVSAMAYAMYCPTDSVAFVTTWYTLAIAVCAALGAFVGSKFLRW